VALSSSGHKYRIACGEHGVWWRHHRWPTKARRLDSVDEVAAADAVASWNSWTDVSGLRLTGVGAEADNALMTRWARILVAALAVSGVFTSTLAACTAGAMASGREQMACCKHGHHKCGSSKGASDCCKKSEQHSQQLVLAKADPFNAPTRTLLLTLTIVQPLAIQPQAIAAYRGSSPPGETIASGPPLYIAFSTLLI